MRNLKELMKDDSGFGITATACCGGANLLCHGANCAGSLEQSMCIAFAALMTNVWTFQMKDSVLWTQLLGDSISNMCGK